MNLALEKFLQHMVSSENDVNRKDVETYAKTGLAIVRLYNALNDIIGPLLMLEYGVGIVVVSSTCFFGTSAFNAYNGSKIQVEKLLKSVKNKLLSVADPFSSRQLQRVCGA